MKKLLQLFLIILLILTSIYFYQKYFKTEKKKRISENSEMNLANNSNDEQNNLIKNLKYEIQFDDKSMYNIFADFSELKYENGIEIVQMKVVTAIFTDKNNTTITVTSDNALYNNTNYNTSFVNNVKIVYMDNVIFSDKMDINFDTNIANINDNVVYEGTQGTLKTDNIKINLISKNIEIFMKDSNDKVEIVSK